MADVKLTGGLTSYYLAQVDYPQREEQAPYQAECEDIIRALDMTFDEGCEFKAIWRTAAARLGNGKPDHKALYDAEKRVHYACACLRQYKQEAAIQGFEWLSHNGTTMPVVLDDELLVDYICLDGSQFERRRAGELHWGKDSTTSAIKCWRLSQL